MLESENSAKALDMFNDLLSLYGFCAELQVCYDKIAVIAVNNETLVPTWFALQLISGPLLSEKLEACTVHECAVKMYDHIKNGKQVLFGNIVLGSKSPGVGKFMIDFILQGL